MYKSSHSITTSLATSFCSDIDDEDNDEDAIFNNDDNQHVNDKIDQSFGYDVNDIGKLTLCDTKIANGLTINHDSDSGEEIEITRL